MYHFYVWKDTKIHLKREQVELGECGSSMSEFIFQIISVVDFPRLFCSKFYLNCFVNKHTKQAI